MNQVITDGLILMPPPFADGLAVWSRQDGTPGSDTYATATNAALVPGDQDFGDCLEILKLDATTTLRYMGQTPMIPGMYLRVSARVKALAGNLPSVRIAGWAGNAGDTNVPGVPQTGPSTVLTAYGEVVTVSAIIGTGARGGVDMPWGESATYGYFGLDLTGPNNGTVRIESIRIEDITSVFHRKLMDWVDVKDFGAVGDGVTDDRAAFVAADAAAEGREVLVSEGTFLISSDLTMQSPVRFQGKVTMADQDRLSLTKNFDLDGYAEAFGDEVLGFKKGLQTLFNQSDHEAFDLNGRRVSLTEPIDVQAVVDNKNTYANRRVLRNGQIAAADSAAWDDDVFTGTGNWVNSSPLEITNVANVANIPVGSLVTAPVGVGREVYVKSRNVATNTLYLSAPLWGAPAQQTYTFTRFKFLLDFIGWQNLQRFQIQQMEFLCAGKCSAVMLPIDGLIFQVQDSFFTGPKDRGVCSAGEGCQGMQLDRNQFLSNEQSIDVSARKSIGFNMNSSDVKIRDNRAVKFLHFGVLGGNGNIISGNHFFQGDNSAAGLRSAGLIFTSTNGKSTFTGNYVDNCYLEWGNEHDANPEFSGELSFHGMTITGNIFFSTGAAAQHRYIRIKPYGPGHFINGATITDNLFKQASGNALDQAEDVDDTLFGLDTSRTSNLLMTGNTFHGITRRSEDPIVRKVTEANPEQVWEIDLSDRLPFDGEAHTVLSVVPSGAVRSVSNVAIYTAPYFTGRQGVGNASVRLNWSQPVKGTVILTASGNRY